MRQTVAVKGFKNIEDDAGIVAIEVWTNGDVVSLTYKDITLAVPYEPVKKLITQVRRNGKKHNQE